MSESGYKIITTLADLETALAQTTVDCVTAVDTETSGLDPNQPSLHLLGVSVSTERLVGCRGFYVPLQHFDIATKSFYKACDPSVPEFLRAFLNGQNFLVGHNYSFDARWLKAKADVTANFKYDTQLMWHLSSAPWKKQSYGLKKAQTDVLHWPERGDLELKEQIASREKETGLEGFHLADLEVLGLYAAKDAHATLLLYQNLKPFFDKHDYWSFISAIQEYRELLLWNTESGIPVNRAKLSELYLELSKEKTNLELQLSQECGTAIAELEAEWLKKEAQGYKSEKGRAAYLSDSKRHPKFNFDSDPQLAALLYDKFKFPISERTPKGKPKTNKLALKQIDHPVAKMLLRYSKVGTLISTFVEPYLKAIEKDGLVHPSYNVTGTVSGRLSGFAPNVQQLPFKEEKFMETFELPENEVGVHMDLVSIEPFFTAYFSRDPVLLKVYRDGHGDIYLDLALKLFPENMELRAAYNPFDKPNGEVKARFKKERDVSKLVHLACQYGGGARTISKNLTLNGFPTSEGKAKQIVRAYWDAFKGVREFETTLYNVYKLDGKLVNPFGRVVRLPELFCKDLLNRFIQGTASDCMKTIVMEIASINRQKNLGMVPLLIDVHDATSWRVSKANAKHARAVLSEAVATVSERLGLDFPIRADVREIKTLAGIKDD